MKYELAALVSLALAVCLCLVADQEPSSSMFGAVLVWFGIVFFIITLVLGVVGLTA